MGCLLSCMCSSYSHTLRLCFSCCRPCAQVYDPEVWNATYGEQFNFKGLDSVAKVVNVLDGDTFDLVFRFWDKIQWRLRLDACDTPEIHPRDGTPHKQLHKLAALVVKKHIQRLMLDKMVAVRVVGSGKFDRLRGTVGISRGCCHSSFDLTDYLVKAGFALPFDGKDKAVWTYDLLDQIVNHPTLKQEKEEAEKELSQKAKKKIPLHLI